MKSPSPEHLVAYRTAGVDTEREEIALQRLIRKIRPTWSLGDGIGAVRLDIGYFANVLDIGGIGLAISTDGVGTKVIIAQMMGKYDTVGIDCVAMNVNDLICVGATPVSMVDYLAVQELNPDMVEAIAEGLSTGAKSANISISGGEIAQLRDIIKGYPEGHGFDLAGTAIGTVPLDKIIVGQAHQEGDDVIGIESNGIHSNGLTLARHVFFERNNYTIDASCPTLERSLGEELLRPTHIYVREVVEILKQGIPVKALIHITSDGFLNLIRVAADVGYVIEELPPIPPIFDLIEQYGEISKAEMFHVYNMGIGFCIIVSADAVDRVISIVRSHGKNAYAIGHAVWDKERHVSIKPYGLVGKGNRFSEA
jgi:phosphoribosylformylglycinamidine cyclo-ligase